MFRFWRRKPRVKPAKSPEPPASADQKPAAQIEERLTAELDLYIIRQVTPQRAAFLGVMNKQIRSPEVAGQSGFEKAAEAQFQLMLDNWSDARIVHLAKARGLLGYESPDAAGIRTELDALIDQRLNREDAELINAGLKALTAAIKHHNQRPS